MEDQAPGLPRQLIVCCDGTNNTLTAGTHDTNVVKLMNLLAPGAHNQKLYYDPGVGTADQLPGTDMLNNLTRKLSRLRGLASGRGIYENIGSAYRFLVEQYREGDQIFLFGFSRGAFTARAVAGMVNAYGLLQPHNMDLLDTLIHAYFSLPDPAQEQDPATRTRAQAAQPQRDATKRKRGDVLDYIHKGFPERTRDVEIHFIGVFDTVESVGLVGFRRKFTSDGVVSTKRYRHVRQALSLDETRWSFTPRIYWESDYSINDQNGRRSLAQRWFRGAHADIGGGYPEPPEQTGEGLAQSPQAPRETMLSDHVLRWMVEEAHCCGLRLGQPLVPRGAPQECVPVLHNEAIASPLWGVAGLTPRRRSLRRSERARMERLKDSRKPLNPYDDRAVVLDNPNQQVERWRPPAGQWFGHLVMLGLMLLFYGCASAYAYAALHGGQFPPLRDLGDLFGAGFDAGHWQRMAFPRFMHAAAGVDARAAAWAVLFDLGLVVTYAWFLGWLAVRRFLPLIGLPGSAGAPDAPRWLLAAVGWLPCALVMAAVAEDIATLLALALVHAGAPLLAYIAALLMAVANNVKWMALAFTLAAFAASWVVPLTARRHPPPAQPRPGLPPSPA